MEALMVKEPLLDFDWEALAVRGETNVIVLHHTGSAEDADESAREIHAVHQALGWNGIGYHYVVRKDGSIEAGRPHWAIGAHAEGQNYHTLGIALSGNFELAEVTKEQLESAALLVAHLTEVYEVPLDDRHVLGHRDVGATACPGRSLYSLIPIIIGKALWYRVN